jgi:hypothetical protein
MLGMEGEREEWSALEYAKALRERLGAQIQP